MLAFYLKYCMSYQYISSIMLQDTRIHAKVQDARMVQPLLLFPSCCNCNLCRSGGQVGQAHGSLHLPAGSNTSGCRVSSGICFGSGKRKTK